MKRILILFTVILSGCTHTLYQGQIKKQDYRGIEREYQLYWTKSEPFIGSTNVSHVVLNAACGTAKEYTQTDTGHRLRLPTDRFQGSGAVENNLRDCGKLHVDGRLEEFNDNKIGVSVTCTPIVGDFDAIKPVMLKASATPYSFPLQVKTSWSFMSNAPAPVPLPCNN